LHPAQRVYLLTPYTDTMRRTIPNYHVYLLVHEFHQSTLITSLNSVNRLVVADGLEFVLCDIETNLLHIT